MIQAAVAQNAFAVIVILLWPILGIALFKYRPANQAILWIILGGFLILPAGAGIKLAPGIPQLDKVSIPTFTALLGVLFFTKRQTRFGSGFSWINIFVVVYVMSPLASSLFNSDPVFDGSVLLPGAGFYDGISAVIGQAIFIVPFWLGRRFLRSPEDTEYSLKALTIAGAIYTLPMLYELRMSPQLNRIIYGYYQFGFETQIREGGFRPVVFLDNGLVTSFFLMSAFVASVAIWRSKSPAGVRIKAPLLSAYLGMVLILCKSLGSLIYGVVLAPIIYFCKPKLQIRFAMLLATLALCYPILRIADLVPTDSLIQLAEYQNKDRAESLKVRFSQEKALSDRAMERPMFGWGRFGRSRIFDESGKDISITDGRWIITLGQFGLVGFFAEFGLLAASVFSAAYALRQGHWQSDAILIGALALIVAINTIDLIPNASLSSWTWLLAGGLVGRGEASRIAAKSANRPRIAEIGKPVLGRSVI